VELALCEARGEAAAVSKSTVSRICAEQIGQIGGVAYVFTRR
jgi:hypothetical protein